MEKQNPTIGSLIWHLSTRWRTEVDRTVAPLGLTHAQYTVLASLHAMTSQPTQRELADVVGLTPIYISKLIRSLESAGNLVRVPDPKDSRAVRLTLSDQGRECVVAARDSVRRLDRELTRPLGEPDGEAASEFRNILKALIQHHKDMGART
ncbi:MAG: winged helix-turn-helix transcriptional regulator [Tabrizicola sp.]|nr:winged helix-turn-helix transcriptional regulator [Tabrizicola sp.]